MAALTEDRNTPYRSGDVRPYGIKASTRIFIGSLVGILATGLLVPAGTAGTVAIVGVAQEHGDNRTGADADLSVKVRQGIYRLANSAGADALTRASIGKVCFAVDDQTVAKTDSAGTRIAAGMVWDVDSEGVWVLVGSAALPSHKYVLQLAVATLVGTGVHRLVIPSAGTVTAIRTVINGALTTGNATLTAAINGVAVTNGVVTITQAGSAAGDVDLASPTAANVVAAGDVLSLTVGGTNDATVSCAVVIEITL